METILSEILASSTLGWQTVALRLSGATILCGLVGIERESRNRPAGLRTHMLVGLAAALYCLIMLESLALLEGAAESVRMDPLRLVEAVTGGVAFLAAGLIIFAQGKVQGLTTGASLWLSAAVGLAAGFGMWLLAILATLLALVIVRILKWAEDGAKGLGRSEDE